MKTAWFDRLLSVATKKPRNTAYQKQLQAFWTGQINKDFLHADYFIENEHGSLFYRIWIEDLAQKNDMQGLRLLKKHIAFILSSF